MYIHIISANQHEADDVQTEVDDVQKKADDVQKEADDIQKDEEDNGQKDEQEEEEEKEEEMDLRDQFDDPPPTPKESEEGGCLSILFSVSDTSRQRKQNIAMLDRLCGPNYNLFCLLTSLSGTASSSDDNPQKSGGKRLARS